MKPTNNYVLVRPIGRSETKSGLILQTDMSSVLWQNQPYTSGEVISFDPDDFSDIFFPKHKMPCILRTGDIVHWKPIAFKDAEAEGRSWKVGEDMCYFFRQTDIIAVERDGKLFAYGAFVFLLPMFNSVGSIVTKSGILTSTSPERKHKHWVVKIKGHAPPMGYENITVNQIVAVDKSCDHSVAGTGIPVMINGDMYSCIQYWDILGTMGTISPKQYNNEAKERQKLKVL